MHLVLCVYTPSGCIEVESLQKNRGYFLQELPKTVKNEGKSRKTVIVAKELAVFSARITGMKMSIAKLLENHGRSGLRSVADPTIQKRKSKDFLFCIVGFFAEAQRLRRLRTRGFGSPQCTKKATSYEVALWVPSGIRTHDIQNHNLTL